MNWRSHLRGKTYPYPENCPASADKAFCGTRCSQAVSEHATKLKLLDERREEEMAKVLSPLPQLRLGL